MVSTRPYKPSLLAIYDGILYPVTNGINLRVHNLLLNLLTVCGWSVDLICIEPEETLSRQWLRNEFTNVHFIAKDSQDHNVIDNRLLSKILRLLRPTRDTYIFPGSVYKDVKQMIRCKLNLESYDGILSFGAPVFGYYLSDLKHVNTVCDVVDSTGQLILSHLKNKRMGALDRISYLYSYFYNIRWEKYFLSQARKIVTISERDKNALSVSIDSSKIFIVENGVDHCYFDPTFVEPGSDNNLLVFTGVMNYEPNHDAMVYFIHDVWPLLKTKFSKMKLRIVGRSPRLELMDIARKLPDIEITGEVKDIREAVKGASVALCPMRLGSGMKNKILEALSMGIPVVTTTEGATGIEFRHGEVGYIADDAEEIVRCIGALIGNKARWKIMSDRARIFVLKNYSWASKAKKLSEIILGQACC